MCPNYQTNIIKARRTYLKAVTQAFLWGSSVSHSATFLPSAECPAVANNEELPPWEVKSDKRGNTWWTLGSETWKTKSAVFFPCVCIVKKGTAVEAACRWSRIRFKEKLKFDCNMCIDRYLPKRCVSIAITDTKLIALLCEHNSVDLGEHPSRPKTLS